MNEIDQYIAQYPKELQDKMQELRSIIKSAAPEAEEKISWGMPTFFQKKNLVHFAMHKAHIGFYPGESGVSNFTNRLAEYRYSKGAIQFPLDVPLPKELIRDIVLFRLKENLNIQ